jgi:hypothetical protein
LHFVQFGQSVAFKGLPLPGFKIESKNASTFEQITTTIPPSYSDRDLADDILWQWIKFLDPDDTILLPDIQNIIELVKTKVLKPIKDGYKDKSIPVDHVSYTQLSVRVGHFENFLEAKRQLCDNSHDPASIPLNLPGKLRQLERDIGGFCLPNNGPYKQIRYVPQAVKQRLAASPALLGSLDEFIMVTDIIYALTIGSGLLDVLCAYATSTLPVLVDGSVLGAHFFGHDKPGPLSRKPEVTFGYHDLVHRVKHANNYLGRIAMRHKCGFSINTAWTFIPNNESKKSASRMRKGLAPRNVKGADEASLSEREFECLNTQAILVKRNVSDMLNILRRKGWIYGWAFAASSGPSGPTHCFSLQESSPLRASEQRELLLLRESPCNIQAMLQRFNTAYSESAFARLLGHYDRLWFEHGVQICIHLLDRDFDIDPYRSYRFDRYEYPLAVRPSSLKSYKCGWGNCRVPVISKNKLETHFMETHIHARKDRKYTCHWRGCSEPGSIDPSFQSTGSSALWDHVKAEHIYNSSVSEKPRVHLPAVDSTAHILQSGQKSAIETQTSTGHPQAEDTGRTNPYRTPEPEDAVFTEYVEGPVIPQSRAGSKECESCHYPPVTNLDGDSTVAWIDKETWWADKPSSFPYGNTPSGRKLETEKLNEDLVRGL